MSAAATLPANDSLWHLPSCSMQDTVSLEHSRLTKKPVVSPAASKGRARRESTTVRSRPRHISLPSPRHQQTNPFDMSSPVLPMLSAAWARDIATTPLDSPEGTYASFWGPGEGSVVSSTSSTESRDRSAKKKASKLERPLVGRPTDNRERCMSVSLVVNPDGTAQVQREEVEVEFLEKQNELGLPSTSLMSRMVSSAGSDISVSRTLNNLSLVNSTRGEVLVRSSSHQPDMSHSIPLTPGAGSDHKFISPMMVRRDHEGSSFRTSVLQTPDSSTTWDDSDTDSLELEDEVTTQNDARIAVQKLYNKKQSIVVDGFVGSSIPVSPMNVSRVRPNNQMACEACQIIFRSRSALSAHTAKCSIKQTPFVSADFLDTMDIIQMSEDAIFQMSSFTASSESTTMTSAAGVLVSASSVSKPHTLLAPSLFDNHFEPDDIVDQITSASPRKKSRFTPLESLPVLPERPQSTSALPFTTKRKR